MPRTLYTARFELPELLERDRSNAISCRVYRDGAVVAATSGTYTVYDQGLTAITTGSATVGGADTATATIGSSVFADYPYQSGWSISWVLVISTVTHEFRNDVSLVKSSVYPVISDVDIIRRVTALNYANDNSLVETTSYQPSIDEAWNIINQKLIQTGKRPYLILSSSSLRESHLNLALALIFEDMASRLNPAYTEQASFYRTQFDVAFNALTWVSTELDGTVASTSERDSRPSQIWMTSPNSRRRWLI